MWLPPNAYVDLAKLRDYCLSPSHFEGKHKARVFFSALGIGSDDAEWLRDSLLAAALREECQPGAVSNHGQRYVMDFLIQRHHRQAMIRAAWIVRQGEDFPRLVSCYLL